MQDSLLHLKSFHVNLSTKHNVAEHHVIQQSSNTMLIFRRKEKNQKSWSRSCLFVHSDWTEENLHLTGFDLQKRFPYIPLVFVLQALFIYERSRVADFLLSSSSSYSLIHTGPADQSFNVAAFLKICLSPDSVCLYYIRKPFRVGWSERFPFTLPLLSEIICHWKPPMLDVWAKSMELTH